LKNLNRPAVKQQYGFGDLVKIYKWGLRELIWKRAEGFEEVQHM